MATGLKKKGVMTMAHPHTPFQCECPPPPPPRANSLPIHDSTVILCNEFASFFKEKCDKIQVEFENSGTPTDLFCNFSDMTDTTTHKLNVFQPLSIDEV